MQVFLLQSSLRENKPLESKMHEQLQKQQEWQKKIDDTVNTTIINFFSKYLNIKSANKCSQMNSKKKKKN